MSSDLGFGKTKKLDLSGFAPRPAEKAPAQSEQDASDRAAERAYSRFKPGDQILASGYIHEYEQERPGGPSEVREQFVARRIGHDCARTRYVVDRTPARQPDPPTNDMTVVNEPASAVGI